MIRELMADEALEVMGGRCTSHRTYLLPNGLTGGYGIKATTTGDPMPTVTITSYGPNGVVATPNSTVVIKTEWVSGSEMAKDMYMNDKFRNDYGYSNLPCDTAID